MRLLAAALAYDASAMPTHALAMRFHAAKLLREGSALAIEAALEERGIASPQRWARMHSPIAEI